MTSRLRLPRNADVFGLFLLLALALLAPMASNDIIPGIPDQANNTAFVVEAKLALDEGQLPLKVAPFATDGLRYPLFQFYSQWPYLGAAIVYKYLTPANPWVAVKLAYLTALCLAAFFAFKFARVVGFDRTTSILAGVVYITAPYILINIHARAAAVEVFAQSMLPIIGWASARATLRGRPVDYLWPAVAWGILGTSHLITFSYSTMVFGMFVTGLVLARQVTLRQGAWLIVACCVGWGLSAFQWYPPATIHVVQKDFLSNPFDFAWLTPLSGLLSFTSVPPEPSGRLGMTPHLHPAVGAPILIAVAGLVYFRRSGPWPSRTIAVAMIFFGLAFFAVWSPVHFWAWLPKQMFVVQFSYRLLTFTIVFGTMLAAYFLDIYQQRYGGTTILVWIVGILALTQSYLPPDAANHRTVAQLVTAPAAWVAEDAYEFSGDAPAPPPGLPLVRLDDARRSCALDGAVLKCTFNLDAPAIVQLPMLYYPTVLSVTVDREAVAYVAAPHNSKPLVAVPLEAGRHRVFATFRGAPLANALSLGMVVLVSLFGLFDVMGRRRSLRARAAAPSDAGGVSTAGPARS